MAQRFSQLFLSIVLGLVGAKLMAQTDYKHTVINDPGMSRQCEILTETRKQKIHNKQRILAMIQRNKHLQTIAPENRVTVKRKLEENLGHLEHELTLTQTQIQFSEETLVRKGCPGVVL